MIASPVQPIHILILEDMAELAELVSEALRLYGFEVEIAPDSATALQLLRERMFHVALVDIDLPDMCGFDMVARARATGSLGQTRVVFCSGGDEQERGGRAQQFPGSSFLTKPFTIKRLLTTIADMSGGG